MTTIKIPVSDRLKEKIDWVTGQLKWKTVMILKDRDFEIVSDARKKEHTIFFPSPGDPPRGIEYLHELAHALLAEKHHLLSTAYFEKDTPEKLIKPLIWPIRTASDWFADDLLMEWVPEEEKAEIGEHLDLILSSDLDVDLFTLYGGGLIFAQALYYDGCGKERYENENPTHCAKFSFLWPVVSRLLQNPPKSESGRSITVEAKRNLINLLAAVTCKLRVEIITEDSGFDVWRVIEWAGIDPRNRD